MKCVWCSVCNSIYSLSQKVKSCDCGHSKGKYLDTKKAIFSGAKAMPLIISNNELVIKFDERINKKTVQGVNIICSTASKLSDNFIYVNERAIDEDN